MSPEDAIMPLAGKIEESGLDNKAPLSNKGKPKQKHKKNSHKKVIFMGMHWAIYACNFTSSLKKKSVRRKKEALRAADNESSQQITHRKRAQIQVTGMSCASCVSMIERKMGQKPGIA